LTFTLLRSNKYISKINIYIIEKQRIYLQN